MDAPRLQLWKRRWLRGLFCLLAAGLVVGWWWYAGRLPAPDQSLLQAQQALDREEYELAESLADAIPRGDPLFPEGRLVAGEAASRLKRFDDAIAAYSAIPRDGSDASILGIESLGEIYYFIGEISRAIECYEEVLRHQPDNPTPHSRMGTLLSITGQRWAVQPHYFALIEQQQWTVQELAVLADLERPVEPGEYLERCSRRAPDDPLVKLALATHDYQVGWSDAARTKLHQVVKQLPDAIPPRGLLGELMLQQPEAEFLAWHDSLPFSADESPDVWYVRGLWFRQHDQQQSAARCFWEALRRAPSFRRACYQLGQSLTSLPHPAADAYTARAEKLLQLTQNVDEVLRSRGRDEASLQRVAELLFDVGRIWEAWAWAETARQAFPAAEWPRSIIAASAPQLSRTTPLTIEARNLARIHDLSDLPLPSPLLPPANPISTPASPVASDVPLRFDDEALAAGLEFTYRNGDVDLQQPGARMFEQTGGGVGVIDFDVDGWPDLWFPQGGEWPLGTAQPPQHQLASDQLYRNHGGRRLVSVTGPTLLMDDRFGQGVAAGDVNGDGFPDCYVGNIGRNRLHFNNGDGTFSAADDAAGVNHRDWTTSCLIADLNADGDPDLFDVNYVDGPQVYERLCQGYSCSPKNFSGVPDRLLISRGDGTYQDVPDATPAIDSKGLGIVVLPLFDRDRLSLFISNDQVPNFCLHNFAADDWPGVRLENDALLSGLAFNDNGLAMACMGVATGDVDANGRTDLFVTNFRDEFNTLYLQDTAGMFVDSTRLAGVGEPSFPYVGWGTQFLDADCDGWPDLVLVNGDVDDYRTQGGMYQMPAQIFRNVGRGQFREVTDADRGTFFERSYLGRGLARLDWNGDGRVDFAVSNLNAPAALAVNRTAATGRYLNLRLTAIDSARDAIGAAVHLTAGDVVRSQHLTAGDGYMASNERVLQFGLGTANRVDELRVDWPSGRTQSFTDLPVDAEFILIEGLDRPLKIESRVRSRDVGAP
ncbi:MAG: VCBS repeat-containing protein [Planctomycetaceae bacterium]|nr:VCBS repeat-containing protein [Planctomycetaceae bacterium]